MCNVKKTKQSHLLSLHVSGERLQTREHLALEVLKNWKEIPGGCELVQEHIETRTLWCSDRPGVEQVWIFYDDCVTFTERIYACVKYVCLPIS